MKTLNHIAAIAALALIFWANSALAQGIQSITLPVSVVNAGATSNINVALDVRKMENVAVALKFNCTVATNVVPLSIVFDKSVDGENWSDKDTYTWSYVRDGTTNSITATTNISVAGYPYLRLKTIQAPGSAGNVNLESFKYFVKFMSTR